MKEVMVGNTLRQCRLGNGYTQEELGEGICSPSTISRIENGSQRPSRSVFTMLVEKMGEERVLYDDYVGDYDYEIYDLISRSCTCLERGDVAGADNYLNKLKYLIGDEEELTDKGKCIYKFAELTSASIDYAKNKDSRENVELYQYGYYLYEEIDQLLESCINLGMVHRLDKMEIRMYNLMGYAKFLQQDYKNAIDIWVKLIDSYRSKDDEGADYPKEMASLYCNISAALSALSMYDEAEMFSERGLRLCFDGGSLRLVNRLLHNRMYCRVKKGDKNKAYIDLAFSKAICTCCHKDVLKKEKLKSFPETPYLIQIF